MNSIFKEIELERKRQDRKWGTQNHNPPTWLSILTEEVGEVAKEVQDYYFRGKDLNAYRTELIQVAAVAIAMIECLDRNRD